MNVGTNESAPRTGDTQRGFWKGVGIGLAIALAGLAILAALMFFTMGRCPLCGDMMPGHDGMMEMNERP